MTPSLPGLVVAGLLLLGEAAAASTAQPFDSQLYACPQLCSSAGVVSDNWTVYDEYSRLEWCDRSVVFDFAIFNEGPKNKVRACTEDNDGLDQAALIARDDSSSTCSTGAGTTGSVTIEIVSQDSSSSSSAASYFEHAAEALRRHVGHVSDCLAPTILSARYHDVLLGLYVGAGFERVDVTNTLLAQLHSRALNNGDVAAQVCGNGRDSSQVMGLVVSTSGDLPTVQTALQSWANSTCLENFDTTIATSKTSVSQVNAASLIQHAPGNARDHDSLDKRAACSYIKVNSGDSCASLATRCKISAADFTKYNPSSTLCSTLKVGQPVCCSSGTVPDLSPQPNSDGTCKSHTVASGEYCALIAENNYITTDLLESRNKQTWGWMGCTNLQLGAIICLSTGSPPMPAVVSNAVCGPQVTGSKRPANWADISTLNPCPLNACCNIWGQCGITPDFCTATKSTTGAPGTAAAGSNGCISHCGTAVTNNAAPPSAVRKIGYFESFGSKRSCLNMSAANLPSDYTHMHYAFAGITADYKVDISKSEDQFKQFAASRQWKRILSFGGWSFSTEQDSFPIFRNTVTAANRATFVQSVVAFVKQYNLDGVDFDWEYPGAPDIPGVPPGSPTDGPNYLSFLQQLRSSLPSNVSISVAAPASYWYLRGFPIANMSSVLDYIVYMTYDLHGQWDFNNTFANPGCPNGNCLRSHVNLTETMYSLAMITKAGVPANKITVGIASYGRSFGMQNPSCTGPLCLFTGPNSTATPGRCTATKGYISQAELDEISSGSSVKRWHDADSDSDLMTYGTNSWVSYMSEATKASRLAKYSGLNFGGSVEWAVDLAVFQLSLQDILAAQNVTRAVETFIDALATSNYALNMGSNQDVTIMATSLQGFDGCSRDQETAIKSGWQQSWKLMNYMAGLKIDYEDAAALEYLGPPAYNIQQRALYEAVYANIKTIQPSWWIPDAFSWYLYVRCDDPKGTCAAENRMGAAAYTLQNDQRHPMPLINFCPKYFQQQTLDGAIKDWGDTVKRPVEQWANIKSYISQGSTWFHELLHIDKYTTADKGKVLHVGDLVMRFNNVKDGTYKERTAYGPEFVKILARYGRPNVGSWIQRNADSLTLFALAEYVRKKIGEYPHLPLSMDGPPPDNVHDPHVRNPHIFAMYQNSTISIGSSSDPAWTDAVFPLLTDDVDDVDDSSNPVTLGAEFAQKSLFPDAYWSSWSSWASLATATTTSSASTPTPTISWTITIYSDKDCAGEGSLYILGGKDWDSPTNQCTSLRSNSLPITSHDDPWCQWFSPESLNPQACTNGTLSQPLSWSVLHGVCTVFVNSGCTFDAATQAFSSADGCYNFGTSKFDPQTWDSVSCGATEDFDLAAEKRAASKVTAAPQPRVT
ncbi:hypothetical protein V8C42DRAFT_328167 [Trichoderma barbatum]